MTDTFLTITPLGGLGEIGMNCQMWNTSEGCVLVDCGIMFPDDQQLGVDVVIPPLEPILAQRGRLLGVVLTHGHEDHIGAVPWLVSFIKGLKLQDVQFGVNSTGTFVFFSEESRSDISAARQNQGITGGDFPGDQCGYGSGGKFRKKRLIIARLGFASQND